MEDSAWRVAQRLHPPLTAAQLDLQQRRKLVPWRRQLWRQRLAVLLGEAEGKAVRAQLGVHNHGDVARARDTETHNAIIKSQHNIYNVIHTDHLQRMGGPRKIIANGNSHSAK